jgi:hypothetical protein
MSIRSQLIPSLCLLALVATAQPATAQYGARIDRPLDRPAVSPYINLFRNGGSGGSVLNYYGLVRPQLDSIQANQQLGQNLQSLQAQQGNLRNQVGLQQAGTYGYSQLGITGHPTTFMSHSSGGAGGIGAGISSGFQGAGAFTGGIGGNLSPGGNLGGGPAGGFTGSQIGAGIPAPAAFSSGSLTGHPATFGIGGGISAGGGF